LKAEFFFPLLRGKIPTLLRWDFLFGGRGGMRMTKNIRAPKK
jgi:hypothetical protein